MTYSSFNLNRPPKVLENVRMAFTRAKAEQQISGLAFPLNLHLLKVTAFENMPETLRDYWRKEIRNYIAQMSVIVLKPEKRRPKPEFFYSLLYEEPFEGAEVENVEGMMKLIQADTEGEGRPAIAPTKSPEQMVEWLKGWHNTLAERLSKGEDAFALIP